MCATIIASSIPVLRAFFKEKVKADFFRISKKSPSNGSSQQTGSGPGNSIAKENVRMSSKMAAGNSANSESQACLELDDLDLEGAYYPVR